MILTVYSQRVTYKRLPSFLTEGLVDRLLSVSTVDRDRSDHFMDYGLESKDQTSNSSVQTSLKNHVSQTGRLILVSERPCK